jgi:hypothetical protein
MATEIWTIEEINDYSLTLSKSTEFSEKEAILVPNPTREFINRYCKMEYPELIKNFSIKPKKTLHTPEILIAYFDDKVPEWAKTGMKILSIG